MVTSSLTFLVASLAATGSAAVIERATCTFTGKTGAADLLSNKANCPTITINSVEVPAGKTLDLTGLAKGTNVIFQGKTTWDHSLWDGPLISISGVGIQVSGASGHTLDGQGALWWDGKGDKVAGKPKFMALHGLTGNSVITGLHILNTPHQAVSIASSSDLTIKTMTIDSSAGDSQGGHNTDGFDVGTSSRITIDGAKVYNQDDCIAINSGDNIKFINSLCSGGHGLSIGSVGGRTNNTVDTVLFQNNDVQSSTNGIRVKSTSGTTGTINAVTYDTIRLKSISEYGVIIEQNYNSGDLAGSLTGDVKITGLKLNNIIGGNSVVASTGQNIIIACVSSATCSNWTWTGVTVTGGSKKAACSNPPTVAAAQCAK